MGALAWFTHICLQNRDPSQLPGKRGHVQAVKDNEEMESLAVSPLSLRQAGGVGSCLQKMGRFPLGKWGIHARNSYPNP